MVFLFPYLRSIQLEVSNPELNRNYQLKNERKSWAEDLIAFEKGQGPSNDRISEKMWGVPCSAVRSNLPVIMISYVEIKGFINCCAHFITQEWPDWFPNIYFDLLNLSLPQIANYEHNSFSHIFFSYFEAVWSSHGQLKK